MSKDETPIAIPTPDGPAQAIWQPAHEPSRGALLCVGGFDGGFAGPVKGLYADLGAALPARGIGVLRLDFRVKRAPRPIDEGTIVVVAGVDWLSGEGTGPVILVGHSYGGVIVLRAGLGRK